jgi:PAS domain S-box-containing protein
LYGHGVASTLLAGEEKRLMRWMQLWLYLLGAVTVLVIVLRRVLHRQGSLNDELYSKQVAIDYVHSGVAWVRGDGTLGSVNPSLVKSLRAVSRELVGRDWKTLFPENERPGIQEAYGQALLMGRVSRETTALRMDGSTANVNLKLVAIHDHKMRLVGHYCLIEDRTHDVELEGQLRKLIHGGDLKHFRERGATAAPDLVVPSTSV